MPGQIRAGCIDDDTLVLCNHFSRKWLTVQVAPDTKDISTASSNQVASTLFRILVCVVGLFVSLAARAEGGCPPGQYPQQGQGWQTCVPIPGAEQNAAPAASPGYWTESWGALATYVPKGIIGVSTGLGSRQEAEQAALLDCKAKAGATCKLEAYYQNACVALAGSDTGYAVSSEPDASTAKSKALNTCTKAGYSNCQIFYASCSKSTFVQR